MIKYIFVFFAIMLLKSCTVNEEAKVSIINKSDGRNQDNKYYWDVTLKNDGEQPAYFAVLMITCWKNGAKSDYKEWAYGDLFPSQQQKERIVLSNVGFENPDSSTFKITYTTSSVINPVQ